MKKSGTTDRKKSEALPLCDEIEKFVLSKGSDHVGTFGGSFEGGIQCQQVPDEVSRFLAHMIEYARVNSYLEIGVAAGGTAWLINHFLKPKRMVLIDDNKHPKAHVRPFVLDGISREEIIGDSHNPVTTNVLTGKFDLVIIDGDHSYEGISADIDNFLPFINDGGYLMLHDSVIESFGIKRKASELKQNKNMTFINEWVSEKYNKCGIALFKVGGDHENI